MTNINAVPDGTVAWIQLAEQDAIRVPAVRTNGLWVLGYFANGDAHVWADDIIAKVEVIPPILQG